jgi:hypothetical protein
LQSLEPGARQRVESPLPARCPLPLAGRKPVPRLTAPEVCPGAVLANLLLAPVRPLRLDILGRGRCRKRSSGWSRKFEDPIALADGRELTTLRDAADYIMKLPKKESDLPEWQTAIEVLMLVARSGPTMMARIGRHEGAQPSCRAGVQSRSQGNTLGEAEAQERPVTVRASAP